MRNSLMRRWRRRNLSSSPPARSPHRRVNRCTWFPEDFTQQMNNEEPDTSLNPGQEPHPTQPESNVDHQAQAQEQEQDRQENEEDSRDARPIPVSSKHQVQPTRTLICWLLRAYTVCTGDRKKVEEVWRSVRKLWKTPDQHDRDNVARVLRRCLRDCDRYGPPL